MLDDDDLVSDEHHEAGPAGHGRDAPDQGDALWAPEDFRADPRVHLGPEVLALPAALALPTVQDEVAAAVRRDPLGRGWLSWFGAVPVVPAGDSFPWPRRSDGRPLAHVLQLDLEAERRNHRAARFDLTGLPGDGLLQFFHDLETYGEPGDANSLAWQVRWLPKAEDHASSFALAAAPDDLEPGCRAELMPLNTEVFATARSPLDLPDDLPDDVQERYGRVFDWLNEYPYARNTLSRSDDRNPLTPWQDGYEPLAPVSRAGGHGFVEENPDYREHLEQALPLAPGDSHVLLLELNPDQLGAPSDWFHGVRPVQVWIRASDLARRDFHEVWAQIRTDA
ncbi:DUF1963 domain-containing protein [Nocardioides sp. dk4132]|uniref:DUF1963 domain-containing protein n=1 Tax=unclassified Nocardioides TaxID=2615069 RepID=UPI0012956B37|nr:MULTISPECIES: DUF1963 domain-containing protein [unclassified Nocardioides]MQW75371.1 DUF1963 domain-containing protein [Nocardioides sp. dk4132]QGA08301.1 DUF1963 domain-containing protein [Nocardioides sp. dk884]